ncbi:MAG: transporter substrate-binding domain-containing protein [Pseudomonadota bacterium]
MLGRLFLGLLLSLVLNAAIGKPKDSSVLQFSEPENLRVSSVMAQKILLEAYKRIGIKINFLALPAARSILMWDDGRLDGISYRLIDSQLENGIRLTTPITKGDVVAFSIKQRFTVTGYESLQPYLVGYMAGVPFLLERLKNIPRKEPAPSIESLFKKLELGRSDVVVESRLSSCFAQKLGISNIIILEPALETTLGFHYLHKRQQKLVAPLEKVLRDMESDGTIKKYQDEATRDFMLRCEPK